MDLKRSLPSVLLGLVLGGLAPSSFGQEPPAKPVPSDKANAYYHFSMGHLYSELAGAYGIRGEYFNKAIDHLKTALKLDPNNDYILETLTDLYVASNQLRAAVSEAEALLAKNPDNLQARRMLGRIYTRLIGDPQQGQIQEEMLKRAIEQYQIVTGKDPKDIDSWVTLGRLYRVSRNSVQAESAFRKALEAEPENEEALTGLAMVYSDVGDTKNVVDMLKKVKTPSLRILLAMANAYEQMRDYSSAAQVLRQALQSNQQNPQIKRALAQNLYNSDKSDEALKLYQDVIESDPKDAQSHLRVAEIYRSKRDFTRARASLDKAIEVEPDSLEARYEKVNLLEAEGKIDQAIAAMKSMLKDTEKSEYQPPEKVNRATFLERLGFLQRSARDYAGAASTFRSLSSLGTDFGPRSAVHVVDTYRLAKDFKKAEEEATAALKQYPKDRMVTVVRANLLADIGRVDEGAASIKSLLKGEGDREVYLTLAQVYEKGKRFADMQKALESAEKLSSSKAEVEAVQFMRGAMFEKMKNFEAAEGEFRKVIGSNPKNAGALNYLGYMFADRGVKLEEARQLIQRAVDLEPDNGAYLDSLGWVHFRLNNLDDAERYLRRAIEQTSGDPTVHDHLGDVLLARGKIRDAIQQWQTSLVEWERNSKSESDPTEIAKVNRKLEGARVRLARENKR
ncbi:MAG: tetratricopeptide repeat protein [Bryobacteraceae bacterium]